MVASDMENESLIDVIDGTSELFASDGPSFNWADEFLGENEDDLNCSAAVESGNLATSGTPSNVVLSQNYANITTPTPSHPVTNAASSSFVYANTLSSDPSSSTTAMVGPAIVNPLQNMAQGLSTQIVQQGNGQFILKAASDQIQLNPQLQFHQPVLQSSSMPSTSSQFQTPIITQSHTGSPSPISVPVPAPSPVMHSRAITPNSGGSLSVTFASSPSSQAGSHFKSTSPSPNVNIVHLPTTLQQHPQQLHIAPGTVVQVPGAGGTQNIVNTGLLQGQSTILPNQPQNIVNTQNTVIQNPNVVNVNVAHVLCNNAAQQQGQTQARNNIANLSTLQPATQNPFNIQGTLIQTPEGKSLLIPSQQFAQPINIQNLQQLAVPTAIGQPMSNVIRLAQPNSSDRNAQGVQHMVVNQPGGQQVLIQRPQTAGQSQNIILRTMPQSGVIQLQQTAARTGSSPIQTTQVQVQPSQTPGLQVIGNQNQPLKILNSGSQSSVPMINIGGQNITLQQLSTLNQGGQLLIQPPQQQQQQQPQPQQIQQNQFSFQAVPQSNAQPAGQQILQKMGSNVVTIPINSGPAVCQVTPSQIQTIPSDSATNAASVQLKPSGQLTGNNVNSGTSLEANSQSSFSGQQTLMSFMQSVSHAHGKQVPGKMQPVAKTLQSMQVPVSSLDVVTTTGCSTAQNTAVTTTVSAASTTMSQYSVSNSLANVQYMQGNAVSKSISMNTSVPMGTGNALSNQNISRVPTLQTIQLSPEQKQKLAQVQNEIRKLQNAKNISTMDKKEKLQQLYIHQKKILLKGQVIMTTKAQPHMLQKQGIQVQTKLNLDSSVKQSLGTQETALIQHTIPSTTIAQPVQSSQIPVQASLHNQGSAQLLQSGQQLSTVVRQPQNVGSVQAIVPSSVSTNSMQQSPFPLPVIKTEPDISSDTVPSSSSISNLLTSNVSMKSISITPPPPSMSSPMVSQKSVISSQSKDMNSQQSSQVSSTDSSQGAPVTVGMSAPTPATQTTPEGASGSLAVPTQIKIGSKVLTLNLTPQQKEKVQGYLDRMTPEQQQMYLQTQRSILTRIQERQKNAQIQAQVQAQKNLQQAATTGTPPTGNSQQIVSLSPKGSSQHMVVEVKPGVLAIKKEEADLSSTKVQQADATVRAQKRAFVDIPKGTLINQQLRQDQNHALNPDTKKPFRNRSDACRRLMRYHVFQSHGPTQEELDKFDEHTESLSLDLLKKKERLTDRFRILLLLESMRKQPSSELVMIQRIQNQDLKKLLEEEKQLAKENPELFVPMPLRFLKKEREDDNMEEVEVKPEPSVKEEPETEDSDEDVQPSEKKMKRLVIKADGMSFSSSFKAERSSLEGRESIRSGDSESGTEHEDEEGDVESVDRTQVASIKQEPVEDEDVVIDGFDSVDETLASPADYRDKVLDNLVASSDPVVSKEFDEKTSNHGVQDDYAGDMMESECERAALSISSTNESEHLNDSESLNEDISDKRRNSTDYPPFLESQSTVSFSQSFQNFVKKEKDVGQGAYHSPASHDEFERHSNLELASESIYFDQTHDTLDNSLNSSNQFAGLSRMTSTEDGQKYISDHSPVSCASNDADTAVGSLMNFDQNTDMAGMEFFGKNSAHVYQPITESLTDSEENSYNSADNSVDQDEISVVDDEGKVPQSSAQWPEHEHVNIEDSDSDHDNDPEVKAQMQNAIDSILSLSQGAPSDTSLYKFDQSSSFFSNRHQDYNQPTGCTQSDSNLIKMEYDLDTDLDVQVPPPPVTIAEDADSTVDIDDDLDAAVNSILM